MVVDLGLVAPELEPELEPVGFDLLIGPGPELAVACEAVQVPEPVADLDAIPAGHELLPGLELFADPVPSAVDLLLVVLVARDPAVGLALTVVLARHCLAEYSPVVLRAECQRSRQVVFEDLPGLVESTADWGCPVAAGHWDLCRRPVRLAQGPSPRQAAALVQEDHSGYYRQQD